MDAFLFHSFAVKKVGKWMNQKTDRGAPLPAVLFFSSAPSSLPSTEFFFFVFFLRYGLFFFGLFWFRSGPTIPFRFREKVRWSRTECALVFFGLPSFIIFFYRVWLCVCVCV